MAGTYHRLIRLLVLLMAGYALLPAPALAWWNSDWSYRKEISVDAGATGGNLPNDAGRVPILIRLHDGNFKFKDAKDDGTDVRFIAADDKTPLNAHIELWDAVLGAGLVWVDVPDVKAGTTLKFYLYYGNDKAPAANNPKATYDGKQVLVWHFTEKTSPTKDWTGYANNADNAIPVETASIIGTGAVLDGKSVVGVPNSPTLAVGAGGAFSLSVWVDPAAVAGNQVVYARHDPAGGSLIIGIENGVPYISVAGQRGDAAGITLAAKEWHQLAVTADQDVTLYVDGQPKETLPTRLPALTAGAVIGGDAATAAGPVASGFTGGIDELEISNIARPAGFIRALWASQGTNPSMVKFGADEANSGGGTNYFLVIIKSVTVDGWVVIGILMVMAVVSWWVMYSKVTHLNRVARGNAAFNELYKKSNRDPVVFETMLAGTGTKDKVTPDEFEAIEDAPYYRLLSAALEEVHDRFGGEPGELHGVSLSEPMIESIHSSLEAVQVLENQSLNNLMVLLTISISGGPFIGLLGTVVGVMITFAAIAASGDVNINAIAPGIAAALLATCAGMFVAIPALFAYNYLLLRIKDETGKMTIFVEGLITRMAELYHGTPIRHDMAAE